MLTKSKTWFGNTIKAHYALTKIICDGRNPVAEMETAHSGFRRDRNVGQENTAQRSRNQD